jgi:hypothetical protein
VEPNEFDFLTHKSSATDHFAEYQPKRIADLAVTAMIKMFAQMRDARRGHDAQGRVKKVRLDASAEGYTNYMAPMRIQAIAQKVDLLEDKTLAEQIYTSKLLKPEIDTYLTAEWDEMVPFPNSKPKIAPLKPRIVLTVDSMEDTLRWLRQVNIRLQNPG